MPRPSITLLSVLLGLAACDATKEARHSTVPESTVPESTVPESTVPESTRPESTRPEPTLSKSPAQEPPARNSTLGAPSAVSASQRRPAPSKEHGEATLRHLVVHTGGASKTEKLPWIVAAHGLGDTPENFSGLLNHIPFKARWYLPAAPTNRDWYDGVRAGAAPQALAQKLESAAAKLARFIRQQAAKSQNQGPPIVTGFSQGGMLSFAMVAFHPDLITASVPIAGMLPTPLWQRITAQKERPPIYALHGQTDRIITVGPTRSEVIRLKADGYPAEIETFEGVAHQIPRVVWQAWSSRIAQLTKANRFQPSQ